MTKPLGDLLDLVLGPLRGRADSEWEHGPPGKWTPAQMVEHLALGLNLSAEREGCQAIHFGVWLCWGGPEGAGASHARARRDPGGRRSPFPGGDRGVGPSRPHALAGAARQPVREAPAYGRPHRRGMDAIPRHSRAPPRPPDPGACRRVSRKREKKKLVVRVPNPNAPVKGRLKTPSHKVHRSKKGYRRREKHQEGTELD